MYVKPVPGPEKKNNIDQISIWYDKRHFNEARAISKPVIQDVNVRYSISKLYRLLNDQNIDYVSVKNQYALRGYYLTRCR